MTTKLPVRFDGSTLVPLESVDIPTGSVLAADLHLEEKPSYGSPKEILEAIESHPKIDSETMHEFDRILAEAQVAGSSKGVFDDLIEH